MTIPANPVLCWSCKRYDRSSDTFSQRCEAFPGGIPIEINPKGADHRQPVEGDHGITFDLADGYSDLYLDYIDWQARGDR